MHTYAHLGEFKDYMREQGSTSLGANNDAQMLATLASSSRRVEEFCGRSVRGTGFGPRIGTNRYDGQGGSQLDLGDDLYAVTSVTVRAATAVVSGATATVDTDYYLQTEAGTYEPAPFRRVILHGYGSVTAYGRGLRVTDVVGEWCSAPYTTRILAPTTAEALDDSETEVDVSALTGIYAGMTLLLGAEQVYVTATTDSTTDSITVERGANGTTAASHLTGLAISRIVYDAAVVDATKRIGLLRWRARDAGADSMDGGPGVGSIPMREGEDKILWRTVGHLKLVGG